MERKHFEKFNQYMAILGEIVGQTPATEKIKIYWKILSEYQGKDIFNAFDQLLRQPRLLKFPVPGDIIALFAEDIEAKALTAWQKVKLGIRRAGYMHSVKFDDPVIHNVLSGMGGWKNFCSLEEEDERFYRPQFLKAYAAFSRLEAQGRLQVIPYLPGEAEIHNTGHGQEKHVRQPMEITDETVKQALEYCPPQMTALPERPVDIMPPDEAKGKIKALIGKITKTEA